MFYTNSCTVYLSPVAKINTTGTSPFCERDVPAFMFYVIFIYAAISGHLTPYVTNT